jgi:hypothetical protein
LAFSAEEKYQPLNNPVSRGSLEIRRPR